MQGEVTNPPSKLALRMLGATALAVVVGMAAARHDARRLESDARARIEAAVVHHLGARVEDALRVALSLGDLELARRHGQALLAAEPGLLGIAVTDAAGRTVFVGQSAEPRDRHRRRVPTAARDIEGLFLGGNPVLAVDGSPGSVELHLAPLPAPRLGPGSLLPWAGLALGLLAAAGAVRLRRRMLALTETAAAIVSGRFSELPRIEGTDEIAWTARSLHGVRALVAAQVDRVHDRNADLLRDVTLKEDRLQRLATFVRTLVAPLHEAASSEEALASLVRQTGGAAGLLFCRARGDHAPECQAVHGFRLAPDDPRVELGYHASSVAFEALEDRPRLGRALGLQHPWMADRKLPLEGVAYVPLRFRGHLEGVAVLAARFAWRDEDLEFMSDAAPPLAIALANRRAYEESVQLGRQLAERNDELVHQRDRLEVVDRLRAQFVANMSHELRTPLMAILGYTELLADDCFGPVTEAQRSQLECVLEASNHLLQLVNQVLDLSRAESGALDLHVEPCDLLALARETVALLKPLHRDRPYTPVVHGTSVVIGTDRERVRQILGNLVSNAIKFTETGTVDVHVLTDARGQACVMVEDTGIGIDAAHMELVFEEFRQVDGSSTRRRDGCGLGLAISRRLAHALGGALSVQSELGHGSTFTLALPSISAASPAPGLRAAS